MFEKLGSDHVDGFECRDSEKLLSNYHLISIILESTRRHQLRQYKSLLDPLRSAYS